MFKLIKACIISFAVFSLLTITACGHYAMKGKKAETVWESWAGTDCNP